jgi:superoxide dismutase, Cu-Zn family
MHRAIAAVGLATLCVLTVVEARQAGPTAKAELKGEGITGTVTLREVPAKTEGATDANFSIGTKAVEITVSASGLKPGAHGLHLHAVGQCEAPGFTSAGGHFDPGPSSNPDPDVNHPFHMGDLPNLIADASGKASLKAITTRVTISDGPLSIFDADGTAVIVHGNPDQGKTGEAKSGVSGGPRVACGVITK